MRNIQIVPVLNGFVCSVGCQQVVYTNVRDLAAELIRFYEHPEETEKHYRTTAVNRRLLASQPAEPCGQRLQDCGCQEQTEPANPVPLGSAVRGNRP